MITTIILSPSHIRYVAPTSSQLGHAASQVLPANQYSTYSNITGHGNPGNQLSVPKSRSSPYGAAHIISSQNMGSQHMSSQHMSSQNMSSQNNSSQIYASHYGSSTTVPPHMNLAHSSGISQPAHAQPRGLHHDGGQTNLHPPQSSNTGTDKDHYFHYY